jgi:hypothetical protein
MTDLTATAHLVDVHLVIDTSTCTRGHEHLKPAMNAARTLVDVLDAAGIRHGRVAAYPVDH